MCDSVRLLYLLTYLFTYRCARRTATSRCGTTRTRWATPNPNPNLNPNPNAYSNPNPRHHPNKVGDSAEAQQKMARLNWAKDVLLKREQSEW